MNSADMRILYRRGDTENRKCHSHNHSAYRTGGCMRSRKQTPPELNGDHVDDAAGENESVDALAAEEAEAEAAEAEAKAAAARARARALRLRREAAEAKAAETKAAETKAAETVAAPGRSRRIRRRRTRRQRRQPRRRRIDGRAGPGTARRADTAAVVEGRRGRCHRPRDRRPAGRLWLHVLEPPSGARPSSSAEPSSKRPPVRASSR